MSEREQFWICTNWLSQDGTKVLGPFESQDLALTVRAYVEKVEGHHGYFVDSHFARVVSETEKEPRCP